MVLQKPFGLAVVGVSFHQDAVKLSYVGEPVTLQHTPSPEYPESISVQGADERMLGHVPKALALRLTASNPEGFSIPARITEVLAGETTGLRLMVYPAGLPLSEPTPTPAPILAPKPAPKVQPKGQQVRTKSGRPIGIFVRQAEDGKLVVNRNGEEVAYPADLVELV